jgi:23S rRNA (adenine2503-C2)-methyltransferase
MTQTPHPGLLGLTQQELAELLAKFGEAPFRARQLFDAIYRQRITGLEAITTFPRVLRLSLAEEGYFVGFPTIQRRFVSQDGTVRYLVNFADQQSVECVWMPGGDGAEEDAGEPSSGASRQATLCLSSQAGCAVGCRFCMTAQLGLQRNLTPGEIAGQVLLLLNEHQVELGRDRINLVFMGQGEPFLNYDNFMAAVRLLVSGAGLAESRMTVSTSGIVPRLADFGREAIRPHLAISLNGSNDEGREQVMPINRKWNVAALLAAAREFPLRPRECLTFEYVLLAGVNDGEQNARELVALLAGLRAKVNLIALNPGPELPFRKPEPAAVERFQRRLMAAGIPAFVRRPRGLDIYAACGQLKRSTQLVGLG